MSTATDKFVANTREKSILSLRSAYQLCVSVAIVSRAELTDPYLVSAKPRGRQIGSSRAECRVAKVIIRLIANDRSAALVNI